MLTKQDIQQLKKVFLTKEEFEEKLEEKLEQKLDEKLEEKLSRFVTKEELDEKLSQFPTKDVLYTMLDEIYKAVTANSQESSSMNFRLQDHEERISLLEKIASSFATT